MRGKKHYRNQEQCFSRVYFPLQLFHEQFLLSYKFKDISREGIKYSVSLQQVENKAENALADRLYVLRISHCMAKSPMDFIVWSSGSSQHDFDATVPCKSMRQASSTHRLSSTPVFFSPSFQKSAYCTRSHFGFFSDIKEMNSKARELAIIKCLLKRSGGTLKIYIHICRHIHASRSSWQFTNTSIKTRHLKQERSTNTNGSISQSQITPFLLFPAQSPPAGLTSKVSSTTCIGYD